MDNAVLALAKDIIFIDFEVAHRKLEPGRNEEIFNFAGKKKKNKFCFAFTFARWSAVRQVQW